jgi:ATP-binding cassette subfamily B (MDR/TAP) protein 1
MDAAGGAKGRDGVEKKEEGNGNGNGGGGDAGKKVPFTGLFRYADGTDVLLMVLGTVGALANGVSQPVMTVIFGQVINAFGDATTDNVLHRVNQVSRRR